MNPKVSVIMPTYHRDGMLLNALDSLALQTYSNFEIVLVDDNADPKWSRGVAEIVGCFRQKYPDVELNYIVNEQNLGSAKTRNFGIACASGDYITFLDDDDKYLPEKIEKQIRFMLDHDADYCISDMDLYYDDGVLCEQRKRDYIVSTDMNALIRYHMLYHITGTDAMMFRKEYIQGFGGFDSIDVGDEFYLMLKAIKAGGKFVYLPESHVHACVHRGEGGLSSGDGKIAGENKLYEFKKNYFSNLKKKDIRYIKTRHYAVIAFAELRRKHMAAFVKNAICAAVISPLDCIRILATHK